MSEIDLLMNPKQFHMPKSLLPICLLASIGSLTVSNAADRSVAADTSARSSDFLQTHCYDCHNSDGAEAGFDVSELKNSAARGDFDRWVEVYDRVASGEMPPADSTDPTTNEIDAFVVETGHVLKRRQQDEFNELGRVRGRRLSHLQLERSLHDLLGIDIPLTTHMPEEQRTDGFTAIADGQSISQHQLKTHLQVVDLAMDEAFRRVQTKPDEWKKFLSARKLARVRANRRCREPEMLNGKAVVWLASTTFYGRLPVTTAAEDGWYRFTFKASGLNVPKDHGIWCSVRTGRCISSAPMLATVGAFELTPEEKEYSFVAWVPKGHMFEVRPADRTLKHGRFAGGQIGSGEGTPQKVAGIAITSAVLERVHSGPAGHVASDEDIHRLLFADLQRAKTGGKNTFKLKSSDPKQDVRRLISEFAKRAFRRPVSVEVIEPFVGFAEEQLENGVALHDALRSGYRAILCSPRFLYFQEPTGKLDDFAIATRMSFMLWNRPPDQMLLDAAASGQLKDPKFRRQQAKRMLADSKADSFVVDLADQWLQLNDIDFTEPDRRMFGDFDLVVQESMIQETHQFLDELLRSNLSVSNLIDSDFTFLNSRLARYYGLENKLAKVNLTDETRKVRFPEGSVRGGLMTHGAILKITANGTATSPVIRGVWMAERLLGIHIPDPPENVPAIEPDIRGASTVRELLEKHKSDTSCASCHIKIDPAGFALENFDPAGRYRQYYRTARKKAKGTLIDASSETPDGRPFQNLEEFQQLMIQDGEALAKNVVRHLIAYGTGATCRFADRDSVSRIASKAKETNYGFRTLLMNVITSDLFVTK